LTTERDRLLAGIMNLSTQLRTQLGDGLVEGVRLLTGEAAAGAAATPSPEPREVVILLSDGRGTAGDPTQFRSGYWGVLDEPTLRAMADETGGQYFHAGSAGRLREVYRELARIVGWTRAPQEVSALAAVGAFLLMGAAGALRMRLLPFDLHVG